MHYKEMAYYGSMAAMTVLVLATAWENGANRNLFNLVLGLFLLNRYTYCTVFHSKCVA